MQLKSICFTEHNDYDYPLEDGNVVFALDYDKYTDELLELKERYKNDIFIGIGVEQGLLSSAKDKINNYDPTGRLDFIIGSSHLVYGNDPYYPEFWDNVSVKDAISRYYEAITDCIKTCDNFDVYGHLDYIVRYAPDQDNDYNWKDYYDYFDTILRLLIDKGKGIEILANYEPSFHYVAEWWKQLYGESEGKDQKGIYPSSVDLTTDLHSMGQFIQDGTRSMFETVVEIEKSREEITIGEEPVDLDGLNYLAGKTVDFVNKSAMNGTILAHTDGQVPNLKVNVPEVNEFYLGQLFYFFEFACGVSGYILGVNPFNQPGVESYKKNMFALLGKPGYEEQGKALQARL